MSKIKILTILCVILFVAVGVCGYFLLRGGNETETTGGGIGLVIDEHAGKYEPREGEDRNLPGVTIPGWQSMTIPANTTKLDMVDFYNPDENKGYYDLTFEIRLIDNSKLGYEVLWTSGLVPSGSHIQTIELNRGLEVGEYECILHVQPYMLDQTPTNNADLKMNLLVR